MSSSHPSGSTPPKRVLIRLFILFSLYALTFTTACTNVHPTGRIIYESPDTVVRLEPASKVSSAGGGNYSHPALLTKDQIDVLLTSVSARTKIGLLRSLIGDPGTPRLFDRTDIGLLSSSIQEALTQARPGEAVVFYRTRHAKGAHARVTSGVLFVRDEVLVLYVANFWHPVMTIASEAGSKDRLDDVRQTTAYVRDHPWVSVGDQDFVIFFDDPKYQLSPRENSLWDHPERTIAIVYAPYLQANPDPIKRAQESEEAVQQATLPKVERQVITDLKKRLVELERANAILIEKIQNSSVTAIPSNLSPTAPPQSQTEQGSLERLLEVIQRLENRISEMEREIAKSKE
ncbi:MAG: hypothetical protein ACT4PN_10815 [Nitrospiraceae bacterium]